MKIVGISGKAGSGKDFLGRLLRRYGYQNIAFAWPLKLEATEAGIPFEEAFYTKPPHVRLWLQERGVYRRSQDPRYWIRQLDSLMRVLHDQGGIPNFVITDMRFPNEYYFVRSMGGKTIRLLHGDRPYPLAGSEAASHISETALDGGLFKWDLRLANGLDMNAHKLATALYATGIIEQRPPLRCAPFTRQEG